MRPLSGSLLLTFRELWAMRITQGMFAIASLAWLLLSFALNMDIVEGSISALKIFGFDAGAPMERVFDEATGEWVQQATSIDQFVVGINQFVFGASYFLGTLLGLFATMPLIAGFLEQGRIDLLLSKPVSRLRLLFGHLLGVWLTVLVLSCYLVGGGLAQSLPQDRCVVAPCSSKHSCNCLNVRRNVFGRVDHFHYQPNIGTWAGPCVWINLLFCYPLCPRPAHPRSCPYIGGHFQRFLSRIAQFH